MRPVPEENAIRAGVINRYYKETDYGPDDDECEIIYYDRVTGGEVMRYDGGDPANRPPLGPSDKECFLRKGLDIDEEIPISRCKSMPSETDIAAYQWRLSIRLEKEQAIERGVELLGEIDLWSYLELAADAFDFENYSHDEEKVLKPALERKGFTRISFFMGEQDSSGPLSRGIHAWKNDKGYIFYYG
jgi:hypothetical protein